MSSASGFVRTFDVIEVKRLGQVKIANFVLCADRSFFQRQVRAQINFSASTVAFQKVEGRNPKRKEYRCSALTEMEKTVDKKQQGVCLRFWSCFQCVSHAALLCLHDRCGVAHHNNSREIETAQDLSVQIDRRARSVR